MPQLEKMERYIKLRKSLALLRLFKFGEEPGAPTDAGNPKLSEGMESFREAVLAAIDARGWSCWSSPNPVHDFMLMELYVDAAIVQDFMNGKFYRIDITKNEDGTCQLSEPVEYDITFTPAEKAAASAEIQNVSRERFIMSKFQADELQDDGILAAYRVRICSTGFTRDGRYFDPEPLRAAVEKGLFDGAQMYYQHPSAEQDREQRRDDFPCSYIKPGSVAFVETKAGSNIWDVVGTAVVYRNDVGSNVNPILLRSLEEKMSGLQLSVIVIGEVEQTTRDGRPALAVTNIKAIQSVDYVEGPAFPRAGVIDKIAAQSKKDDDIMTPEEIAALNKKVADLEKADAEKNEQLALIARKAEVDQLLAASTLPEKLRSGQAKVLMLIADPELRKATLEASVEQFWAMAGKTPPTGPAVDDKGKVSLNTLPAGGKVFATIVGKCDPEIMERARQKTFAEIGR